MKKNTKSSKNTKGGKSHLIRIENFLENNQKIEEDNKTFEKLMFIYAMAIKEINTKLEILKNEYEIFYQYDLIDHINTRIKKPQSIINKMEKRGLELTYKEMIEHINDIAGIRVVCTLKNDIYTIRDILKNIDGIRVFKEKDYVEYPKESGYKSYHMIVEVPVYLSQNIIYVKVEIQIRTMAMDFWATLDHKMRYKKQAQITKKEEKEWLKCAQMAGLLDNKMVLLNEE